MPPSDLRVHLRDALLQAPPPASGPPDGEGRPAAVLIPLIDGAEPSIVFTKRADDLPRHAGEMSFPGGLRHESDRDLLHTALRETEEELGLAPSDIEVLGALEPFLTYSTGFWLTPFVGALSPGPRFAPSPAEIAEVVEVPLTKLAQIEREVEYQRETWTWTGFAYEVNEHTIWGATGRILHEFLEILRKEMSWPRTN